MEKIKCDKCKKKIGLIEKEHPDWLDLCDELQPAITVGRSFDCVLSLRDITPLRMTIEKLKNYNIRNCLEI